MATPKTGNPVGRPPIYRAAFCERVVEFGAQGKSKAWIAAEFGVSRETLDEWTRSHPEFSDAMTRARAAAQRWWEDAGQAGMTQSGFNGSVWSRSMAARFPDDWRETTRQEQTGVDGHAIAHKITVELVKPKE